MLKGCAARDNPWRKARESVRPFALLHADVCSPRRCFGATCPGMRRCGQIVHAKAAAPSGPSPAAPAGVTIVTKAEGGAIGRKDQGGKKVKKPRARTRSRKDRARSQMHGAWRTPEAD